MLPRARVCVLVLAALSACARPDKPSAADSATPQEPEAQPAVRSWQGSWTPELGELLVLPSDSDALVVYPDDPSPATLASGPVTLLSAAGDTVARAVTVTLDDTLQCGDAPLAHVPQGTPGGWSLGLRGATVVPVRVDSIESLPGADSAKTVAELARLASAITATSRSRFTGLPFSVVQARRFQLGASQVLAAHLVRRLPQEAEPLEEHLLVIAERARPQSPYATRFSQQSQGSEETAQYFDVVGVARAGDVTLLMLARDASARTEYQILERSAAGEWRVRWTRVVSC